MEYQKLNFPQINSNVDEIEAHVLKYLGEISYVYHEIVSDLIHIDILVVKPNEKTLNNWVLVTLGMSDLPMNSPEDCADYKYAELICVLPGNWKIPQKFTGEVNKFTWPVINMQHLARIVHTENTWFSYGHIIQNSDPPEPFASNVKFCATLFCPPIILNEEFITLKINDAKVINFYATIPLFKEELEYKMENGIDALLDKFNENGISEIIDGRRNNTLVKKWWEKFNI